MRIFLSLSPSGNSSVPGSLTWIRNFYEPLKDLGHEVILFRIDEAAKLLKADRGSQKFKERFSQFLLEQCCKENEKEKIDFFLSYFEDNDIFPEIIDQIKNKGILTANFSCNNIHQFYLTQNIASSYDYNLHSEKFASEKFIKIGANPIWFQMAANPKYYHPIQSEKMYDVSFIGGNYAKRSYYAWHLLEHGINVHCFGPNWLVNKPYPRLRNYVKEYRRYSDLLNAFFSLTAERRNKYSSRVSLYDFNMRLRTKYKPHLHYPVSDEMMIKLYSQSNISLGFLEVFDNHDSSLITKQHLHLREFEAPMCGSLYFTNYCQELEEFYEPDKEVIVYRNEYELLDKVKFYLTHPAEANIVREAGYKRAINCHTYQKRFYDLLKLMPLK
jgi:spore maturation protein CgeB